MKNKISILLPAYKSEYLCCKIFNHGWRKNTKENVELIVYDNGGNGLAYFPYVRGAAHMWETPHLSFKIIGDGKNIGLNAALNKCAEVATGDYFFLPHTDMYLLPGWDVALLNEAKKHAPTSFLFCCRSIEPGHSHIPSQIIKDYGNEWDNFQEQKLLNEYKQYIENKIVVNARMPFFMNRKLWEKMGGVDENYFSYCTDDDLIQEAYDCGVRKFYMMYNSLVYHLQGKSNKQQNVDRDDLKPYEYFIKKWKERGYKDAHHPGQWHPKLIPFEMRAK